MKYSDRIDKSKTENLITVTGGQYIDTVVLDLLEKAFDIYKESKPKKSYYFQSGMLENSYSTSGILLTVMCIESYCNRIRYLKKEKIDKSKRKENCYNYIPKVLKNYYNDSQNQFLKIILTEIYIIRDLIMHNHLYQIKLFRDDRFKILGYRQKLLSDYGFGDNKLKDNTNKINRKTNILKLNVQPLKVGYEDFYMVLQVLDLFLTVCRNKLGNGFVPFHINYKLHDEWSDNLSEILSFYHNSNPYSKYRKRIIEFTTEVRLLFESKDLIDGDLRNITNNRCPKCYKFGFYSHYEKTVCKDCGFEFKIGRAETILAKNNQDE